MPRVSSRRSTRSLVLVTMDDLGKTWPLNVEDQIALLKN